ncbi:unnamed protein product [Adineta steineri]|uniref:Uncharacterized protein n=1 Tax=Adineta steineri TaxID=433720 RepID=A0A818H5B3_9BILA|nr:unnamed protein product [Adineta steineri]CAF3500992.1 unnamed protein product [Adineta steineri]
MVTANINHERRPSSDVDSEDDENSSRQIQKRLDQLYLDNSQYNHVQHQYSQRTFSPTNTHETYMTSNTVPVYRHGRKFYVSIEEFERMRLEQRRHRRTLAQKSQNLPVSKSHQTNLRSPSISLYNPVHRSTSHPHDYRYGVLRTPHLPMNSIINTNNNRYDSTRQSRLTSRYYDNHDDSLSYTSAVPMKLSTTAIRSNSSDTVVDLQRTPEPSISSYHDFQPDDYELKRSFSAEIVQPQESSYRQQPLILPRRILPPTTSDYGASAVSSFPITSNTDQTYNQSNASKLTNYYNRMQPSTLNSTMKPAGSTLTRTGSIYETDMPGSADPVYPSVGSSNRHTGSGLTSLLTRSSSTNSNHDYYYNRDAINGSFSDDNSSSPSMLITRRNANNNRYRRSDLAIETDNDYRQQDEIWPRSTIRSHSSDGLTEKKRVRFADMEGFTLETVPDIERDRSPMNNRLLIRRSHVQIPSNLRGQAQPFHNSFYQTNTRASSNGSKLATDV